MKQYWRIQNTSDIKQCLQKLNVGSDYRNSIRRRF